MKKIIYIIPGLGENCSESRYKKLIGILKSKNYEVKPVNPNWYQPISEQIFPVEKNAIIFGFSIGAIFAYLIVKKYPCKKIIFASMSPIHEFTFEEYESDLCKYMDRNIAKKITTDVKKIKISLKTLKTPFVTMAGELEKIPAEIIIPKTKHRITNTYIKCIEKLL